MRKTKNFSSLLAFFRSFSEFIRFGWMWLKIEDNRRWYLVIHTAGVQRKTQGRRHFDVNVSAHHPTTEEPTAFSVGLKQINASHYQKICFFCFQWRAGSVKPHYQSAARLSSPPWQHLCKAKLQKLHHPAICTLMRELLCQSCSVVTDMCHFAFSELPKAFSALWAEYGAMCILRCSQTAKTWHNTGESLSIFYNMALLKGTSRLESMFHAKKQNCDPQFLTHLPRVFNNLHVKAKIRLLRVTMPRPERLSPPALLQTWVRKIDFYSETQIGSVTQFHLTLSWDDSAASNKVRVKRNVMAVVTRLSVSP